jgi:hypothetical protein
MRTFTHKNCLGVGRVLKGVLCLVYVGLAAGFLPAADFPSAEITNGELRLKIYLPDAKNGFYRSTRFDWSGVIYSLQYKGHEYYGPWFQRIDAGVYDLGYEPAGVVSAPFTAMVGPGEEFYTNRAGLGWDEAAPGGGFIKIGVGLLRKPAGEGRYDHSKPYDIIDPGKWTVKTNPDSVEFTQELKDPSSGYGYVYRKVVRLTAGKPEMVIEHQLKNTGTRPIQSNVYNHNFLVLDSQPPGPDFEITFPFQLEATRGPTEGLGAIRGNRLVYLKPLEGEERMTTTLRGFGSSASDYDIRVENRKVGAGFRVRADRPLSNIGYWSIRTVLAVEPYIEMAIEPGSEFTWNLTYEYYTLVK